MLKLGIGNGSLLKPVAFLLRQIGINIDTKTRASWQTASHDLIESVLLSRPQHILEYLTRGLLDCALIGKDVLVEFGGYGLRLCGLEGEMVALNNFTILQPFPVSKSSFTKCARVVLFTAEMSNMRTLDDLRLRHKTKKVAFSILSKYPNLSNWFLENQKIANCLDGPPHPRLVVSTGSTEGPVGDEIYDYGVGIIDTGETLDINNVRTLATIMESPLVLIAKTRYSTVNGFELKISNEVLHLKLLVMQALAAHTGKEVAVFDPTAN